MSDLRDRIRAVARSTYEEHGPAAVSARKLAEHLGVSQMAMYRHYRNKEELLHAVVEEGFGELTEVIRKADTILDPLDRLLARSVYWLEFALDHPQLFELMFTLPRSDARRYPDDFIAKRSPTGIVIEDDIQEAMRLGKIEGGDPLQVAMMMWGTMHGLIMLQLRDRIALTRDDLKSLYSLSVLRMLTGTSGSPPTPFASWPEPGER